MKKTLIAALVVIILGLAAYFSRSYWIGIIALGEEVKVDSSLLETVRPEQENEIWCDENIDMNVAIYRGEDYEFVTGSIIERIVVSCDKDSVIIYGYKGSRLIYSASGDQIITLCGDDDEDSSYSQNIKQKQKSIEGNSEMILDQSYKQQITMCPDSGGFNTLNTDSYFNSLAFKNPIEKLYLIKKYNNWAGCPGKGDEIGYGPKWSLQFCYDFQAPGPGGIYYVNNEALEVVGFQTLILEQIYWSGSDICSQNDRSLDQEKYDDCFRKRDQKFYSTYLPQMRNNKFDNPELQKEFDGIYDYLGIER